MGLWSSEVIEELHHSRSNERRASCPTAFPLELPGESLGGFASQGSARKSCSRTTEIPHGHGVNLGHRVLARTATEWALVPANNGMHLTKRADLGGGRAPRAIFIIKSRFAGDPGCSLDKGGSDHQGALGGLAVFERGTSPAR